MPAPRWGLRVLGHVERPELFQASKIHLLKTKPPKQIQKVFFLILLAHPKQKSVFYFFSPFIFFWAWFLGSGFFIRKEKELGFGDFWLSYLSFFFSRYVGSQNKRESIPLMVGGKTRNLDRKKQSETGFFFFLLLSGIDFFELVFFPQTRWGLEKFALFDLSSRFFLSTTREIKTRKNQRGLDGKVLDWKRNLNRIFFKKKKYSDKRSSQKKKKKYSDKGFVVLFRYRIADED